jgi:hypothetical protein
MDSLVRAFVVALPLLLLPLLAGLGLIVHVVANEGQSRSAKWARAVGTVDLLMVVPFAVLGYTAEAGDIRGMFAFASVAYAIIGVMALRVVTRYREE